MFDDVPAEQILPELEKSLLENMKKLMANEKKKIVVERLEWTEKGIRVWIHTKK